MKITQVGVKNVNGITGTLELSGKDIILGPNGSGKSTFLKAVGLAIRGKDPDRRIGAKPITIRRLASGEEMAVQVQAREGERKFGVMRSWKEKEGAGEQKIKVAPSRDEKTQAAVTARIVEELGDFPVVFDFEGEYGSLSDDKKRDYIFRLCAGEASLSREEIKEKVEAGLVIEAEDGEAHRQWAGRMLEDWDGDQPFMVNFGRILAFLAAAEKELRQKHKEAQAAARKLVELKNSSPENLTQFNAREIREKIEKYENERRRLDREIATAEERINAIKGREASIADLEKRIKALPELTEAQKKDLSELPGAIRKLEGDIWEIAGKKQSVGTCPVGKWDCEDLLAARDQIEAENANLEREYSDKIKELQSLQVLHSDLKAIEEKASQREFLSGELRKLQKAESGPIGDVEQMRRQVSGVEANLAKLKEELQEKERAKLAWEQAETAALSREGLEAEIQAVKDLRGIVGPRGIQGDIVKGIMRPLASSIQQLMVNEGKFDFRMTDENGKEVFELGFSRGGNFIQVPSGGEEILFRAALLAALVAQRSPKCKLLLFELAECDRENGYRLLEALGKFVDQGKLDNVLIASCHDMVVPEGFRAHILKRGAAAVPAYKIEITEPVIVGVEGDVRESEICPSPGSLL